MDTLDAFDGVEVGRRLGHDFHRWSRLPARPDWPDSVREGFDEAAARRTSRADADRFHRKWLQLRLGAWSRGRAVADDVTPDLLRQLDIARCPVTREPLTHALREDTDASIDRLNNDGAYASGNLAVLSVRANRAKGAARFDEVLAIARGGCTVDGLTPEQWLRLAVLMEGPSYATRQHLAPLLPLVAPMPCRSVRLAIQQVQRLFTVEAGRPAGKNALVKAFRAADHRESSAVRLRLLADAVHEGLKRVQPGDECWDVWLQPGVMDALRAWREALDDLAWARAARIAGVLAGGRRVTASALQPWHLASRGYAAA